MNELTTQSNVPGTPQRGSFLRKSLMHIGIVAIVLSVSALSLAAVFQLKKSRRLTENEHAMLALSTANNLTTADSLYKAYPNNSTTPLILLRLASLSYANGDIDKAQGHYETFISDYPTHSMREAAELCVAYCYEAKQDYQKAIDAYNMFEDKNDNPYRSLAMLGKGRCYELLGQWDEARVVYEDLSLASQDGPWSPYASLALRYLEKDRLR